MWPILWAPSVLQKSHNEFPKGKKITQSGHPGERQLMERLILIEKVLNNVLRQKNPLALKMTFSSHIFVQKRRNLT